MTHENQKFDLFTAKRIEHTLLYDSKKFFELFADLYVVAYRTEHKKNQFYNTFEQKRNNELKQVLDLCRQCIKLVETTKVNQK